MTCISFRNLFLAALFPLQLLIFNGCTVVGFGVGTYIDSKSPRIMVDPSDGLNKVKDGDKIRLSLESGDEIEGIYDGLGIVDSDSLSTLYDQILQRNSDTLWLPSLGETVTVFFKPEKSKVQMVRVFKGFEYVKRPDGDNVYINYEYVRSSVQEQVNVKRVHRIENENSTVDYKQIHEFIDSGGLWDITTLRLKDDKGERTVPFNDIAIISLPPRTKMSKILGAAGFISDVILIALFKSEIKQTVIPDSEEEE